MSQQQLQQLQQQLPQQQQLQRQQLQQHQQSETGRGSNTVSTTGTVTGSTQDRYGSNTGTNESFDTGNDTAVDPELRYLQREMNMFNPYSPQNGRGERDFYQNGGRGGEDYGVSPPPSTFNPMSPTDNNGQMFNPLSPGSNFDLPPTPGYDVMSPPGSHTRPGAPIPPGTTAPVTPVDGSHYIPQPGSGSQGRDTGTLRAPQATAPIHEQLLTPASNERVHQQAQHIPDHYRSGLLTHNGGGYAGNGYGRNGMPLAPPSESSYSVSSTPYPGHQYNPFLRVQANHLSSMHSSPSHLPLDLEMPMPMRRSGARGRIARMGGGNSGARRLSQLQHQSWPPRGESTIPADTEYDETPSQSEGEEEFEGGLLGLGKRVNGMQAAQEQELRELLAAGNDAMQRAEYMQMQADEEDLDEWVDEADSDEDLEHELDLWDPMRNEEERSHPKFIKDEEKRRRKWEVKFGELVKLFHELDRLTDTPMVLLAAPPHAPHSAIRRKPHLAVTHSIRRDPAFTAQAHAARRSYSSIVSRLDGLRQLRSPPKASSRGPSNSSHSSPSNADSLTSEEQLRKTLMAALGSLKMLGKVYDKREQRRMEEASRQKEERDSIEKVLNMVLMGVAGSTIGKGTISEPHLRSPGLGGMSGLPGSGNTSGTGTTVTPSAPTPDNGGSTTPT